MARTTWIVQRNPNNSSPTLTRLNDAVRACCYPLVEVLAIPFSEELPDLPAVEPPFVFYGLSSLILNAYRSPQWRSGVFFSPEAFRPEAYVHHYGDRMLNADQTVCTFAELDARGFLPELELFIKPNDDLKRFTGRRMTFGAFCVWFRGFDGEEGMDIGPNTELVFCAPKEFFSEWRLFIVKGDVVAASRYAPTPNPEVPEELLEFGRESAAFWSPAPVFVMDVTRTEAGPRIIELNCFNGCGFYRADVQAIVRTVSAHMESAA